MISEEIKTRVVRRYNENPHGWQVFTARDTRGHIDTVFVQGEDVFAIKEEVINPFSSIGVGVQERVDMKKSFAGPSFGLRPLDYTTLEMLLAMNANVQRNVVGELMGRNPVSIPSINAPAVIQGPVMQIRDPLSMMGDKQKDVNSQLKEELDRLLEKKYPHLKTMYG
ncbi:MAG: hypothetical protein FJ358_04575 [Thaumarchaeota archaeon]|nr:hypothetical protein [Nitrososphaerota archaeon]